MAPTAKNEHIPFNPAMFRWARERAGLSVEQVADRMGQQPERIEAWENDGVDTPTVRQARTLAELYHRCFVEFFLNEPPELPKPSLIPDFRIHRGTEIDKDNRGIKTIQIWAEAQRSNALDLFEELGEKPTPFPKDLSFTIKTPVEQVAQKARTVLNFDIEFQTQMSLSARDQLPNIIRNKLEKAGILVLKNSKLSEFGARGICLIEFPLPVVVFGNEAPSAQAFTLIHEFAHVIIRQSGVIAPMSYQAAKGRDETETWCDQFSASFLMPKQVIASILGTPPVKKARSISDERLRKLANDLRVSPHAMLIRLVHLGYVEPSYYWSKKKSKFEAEENAYRSFGRSQYYGTRYKNTFGEMYTSLVMEAWSSGRITNHNAAEYMGIKNLRHLYDIRDHFGVS